MIKNAASIFIAILWQLTLCGDASAWSHSRYRAQVGTNLLPVNYYTEQQPFLNIIKVAAGWNTRTVSGNVETSEEGLLYASFLDLNGYPTTLTGGPTHTFNGVSASIYLGEGGTYPAGNYTFRFDGTGTIVFGSDGGGTTCTSSPCTVPVTPTVNGILLTLTSTGAGASYARNMSLVLSTYDSLYQGGEIFNPVFIAKERPYTSLRFMDWSNVLAQKIDVVGYISGATLTVVSVSPNYLNVGTAFSQGGGGAILPGTTITGLLTGTGGAGSTYSVNKSQTLGSVGSPVALYGASLFDTSAQLLPYTWAFWNDNQYAQSLTGGVGIKLAVPAQVMAMLANELHSNPWITLPANPTTNYLTAVANIFNQYLDPTLTLYVEDCNEVWGGVPACQVQEWAVGGVTFPSTTVDNAKTCQHVYQTITDGNLFKGIMGSSRVKTVLGSQAGFPGLGSFMLDMTTTGTCGSGSNLWTGAAYTHIDAMAVAPYLGQAQILPAFPSALADGGMDWAFQEINGTANGGKTLIPTTNANLGNDHCTATANALGGTGSAFTLTSDATWGAGAIPATPANGQMIQFTSSIANLAGATLKVDSETSGAPILDNWGQAINPGDISGNGTSCVVAVYTSSTSAGAPATVGWRLIYPGYPGGMQQEAWDLLASNVALKSGRPGWVVLEYEEGPNITDYGHNVTRPNGSITWAAGGGGTATITTTANHGFPNGVTFKCSISGVTPAGYNVNNTFCTSTGAATLTYGLGSNPGVETIAGSYTAVDPISEGFFVNINRNPLMSPTLCAYFHGLNVQNPGQVRNYFIDIEAVSLYGTFFETWGALEDPGQLNSPKYNGATTCH